MKGYILFLTAAVIFILFSCSSDKHSVISLKGEWQFAIDPEDEGIIEKWHEKGLAETISLPGSMEENGKGYDITLETQWTGDIRNPEWYIHPDYAPYHDPDNVRFPYLASVRQKIYRGSMVSKNG
jgi:beta-galactosidase/beta-glucuronidase